MILKYVPILISVCLLSSCHELNTVTDEKKDDIDLNETIQDISNSIVRSEVNNDLNNRLQYYSKEIISMQEYQPTIEGLEELKKYYAEMYRRQDVKSYVRDIEEIIDLGSTKIEIGTFNKVYRNVNHEDSVSTLTGKYWNVWELNSEGKLILKGEALGYFSQLTKPEEVVTELKSSSKSLTNNFELSAYNALMEKAVRERNGLLRSAFFTQDAVFMPFADSTKIGIETLKPYMIEYNSGNVKIDSINIFTYAFKNYEEFVLEYNKFNVVWQVSDFSGRTQGKGIRIWKRQSDQSLKIFREIGLHNL